MNLGEARIFACAGQTRSVCFEGIGDVPQQAFFALDTYPCTACDLYTEFGITFELFLIVVRRCTSVTDSKWDIMRVIPCCAVTGEAAGIAAAISCESGKSVREIDVEQLRKTLRDVGARIE